MPIFDYEFASDPETFVCSVIELNPTKCKELVTYFKDHPFKLTAEVLRKSKHLEQPRGSDFGWNPLHLIMSDCHGEGCLELVQYIVDLCPELVSKTDLSGRLPIHAVPEFPQCDHHFQARIFLMEQYRAGLSQSDEDLTYTATPFSREIKSGSSRMVAAIVERFPDLVKKEVPRNVEFPRDVGTCKAGHSVIVLDDQEDGTAKGMLPFVYAVQCGKFETASVLLPLYPEALKHYGELERAMKALKDENASLKQRVAELEGTGTTNTSTAATTTTRASKRAKN